MEQKNKLQSTSQLKNYLRSSSPLSKLQLANKFPLNQIHNSIDLKISLLKESPRSYIKPKEPKDKLKRKKILKSANVDASEQVQQYLQMKASSIIYNIPEMSPPQINFEVSDYLKQKINQIKEDIVTKLPTIKSSQFSSNKLQSLFSRRTVLKDLQSWLQQKLKEPPLTYEDSIEYKNMIMGVGMKQVIRLIGTRCAQQATFVSQIWELTWSICRQIILYLSKRAHKCQKILQQEAKFFRVGCENKIKQTQDKIKQICLQNRQLKQRSDKLSSYMVTLKKKNKELKLTKLNLQSSFEDLKQQFQIVFKQNLLFHLKMAPNDEARRDWVKKKYMVFLNSKNQCHSMFQKFMQKFLQENNIQFDHQELSQLELTADLNKFKQMENIRIMQIQKQLSQRLRMFDKQIQTQQMQRFDKVIQTLDKQNLEKSTQTQILMKFTLGVNTQNVTQEQEIPKRKQKKQKVVDKKIFNNRKLLQKKKVDIKINNKTKTNKNLQLTPQKQQHKQQFNKSQQQISQNKISQSIPDIEFNNNKQQCKESTIFDVTGKNIQTILNIKDSKQEKSNSLKINKEILENKNTEKKNICQDLNKKKQQNVQNSSLKDQQQKQIKQKIQMYEEKKQQINNSLELQKNLTREIQSLKLQLESKNQSIRNLNNLINTYKKKNEQEIIKYKNEIDQKILDVEDQDKEIFTLLKAKEYKQILKYLSNKLKIKQKADYVQQQLDINQLNQQSIIAQILQIQQNQKDKQIQQFHYVKKRYFQQQKRKGTYVQKLDEDEQIKQQIKNIKSNNAYKFIQNISPRGSKRGSMQILNKKKNFKLFQKVQQGNIVFNNYHFSQICANYFQNNLKIQSNINSFSKQGINDLNKRALRQQFKQIHKQVIQDQHTQKTQKQMRTIIQKTLGYVFKQLCKEIQNALKQGVQKMLEIKMGYNPIYLLLTNRFNMNFGVKKVASKHIKDLLVSLKGIRKYTDKYSIFYYFMMQSPSITANSLISDAQDSELLFFYTLLITISQDIISSQVITSQQIEPIIQLTEKYLTRDTNFLQHLQHKIFNQQNQNSFGFVNFYKKIVQKYLDLYLERRKQTEFIYKALCKNTKQWRQGIFLVDFITFISAFSIRLASNNNNNWHILVINTIIQCINEDKHNQDIIITYQCFCKFVFKCPQFSISILQQKMNSLFKKAQFDLSSPQTQQQLRQISKQYPKMSHLIKYVFETENLSQMQIQFLISYIKLNVLETQVDDIMGSLLIGPLDSRSKEIIIQKYSHQKQDKAKV